MKPAHEESKDLFEGLSFLFLKGIYRSGYGAAGYCGDHLDAFYERSSLEGQAMQIRHSTQMKGSRPIPAPGTAQGYLVKWLSGYFGGTHTERGLQNKV